MPTLNEIITANADKFADVPGIAETLTTVSNRLGDLGHSIIVDTVKEPGFVPKHRLDEVITQRETLKTQAAELSGQLETLKKSSQGNEALQKQIGELQGKLGETETAMQGLALESAIKLSAVTEKARDAADILKFIDTSKLKLNADGTVAGLSEQFNALKESKAYLFDTGTPPGAGKGGSEFNGGNPPPDLDTQIADALKAGDIAKSIALKNQKYLSQKG